MLRLGSIFFSVDLLQVNQHRYEHKTAVRVPSGQSASVDNTGRLTSLPAHSEFPLGFRSITPDSKTSFLAHIEFSPRVSVAKTGLTSFLLLVPARLVEFLYVAA